MADNKTVFENIYNNQIHEKQMKFDENNHHVKEAPHLHGHDDSNHSHDKHQHDNN